MSPIGAAPHAAVSGSDARVEASRRNDAKSRGPNTEGGKARSAQNALKHGMRALKYVVLPDESAAEFHTLQEALMDELAPVGALQLVLARRVAVAAWRLARADRMEMELFEELHWENGSVGIALIRDGNGTRSFETLMRYRGAALAEFMRSLAPSRRSRPSRRMCSTRGPGSISRWSCLSRSWPRRPPCAAVATRNAPCARRGPRTERTRAPHGIPAPRTAHGRPDPARAAGIPDAERTQAWSASAGSPGSTRCATASP